MVLADAILLVTVRVLSLNSRLLAGKSLMNSLAVRIACLKPFDMFEVLLAALVVIKLELGAGISFLRDEVEAERSLLNSN